MCISVVCVEQRCPNFLGYELIAVKSSAINSLLGECPVLKIFQLVGNQFLPTNYKPKRERVSTDDPNMKNIGTADRKTNELATKLL